VGSGEVPIGLLTPHANHVEQSPEAYWQGTVAAVRGALAEAAVTAADITGIGFSHQRGTFLLADESGAPLTNFVVWMDHRGVPYLDFIRERMEPLSYYDITGVPIYFVSSLSKLVWFAQEQPDLYRRAHRVWPIAHYIMARMGAADPAIDHATGSFTGLMDTHQRAWSGAIIDRLGLDAAKLPPLVAPGTVVGELASAEAAEELGLRRGTPLVIGGGDQQCAALGSGMIEPGQSLLNLGTATAVMAAVEGPVLDPHRIIPTACHAAPGGWEMEGHTQASGIVFQRFRDEVAHDVAQAAPAAGRDPYDLLTEEAARSRPGADGLIFLPTLTGTTAPLDYPYGSGAVLGLHVTHTRADVVRALLEGICLESRWILEQMERNGAPIREVYLAGGGSKSPFWCQLHADILQRPITRVSTSNAAAVGAAICAGLGTGVFRSAREGVAALSELAETYEPQAALADVYGEVFSLFTGAYTALVESELFKRLHDTRRVLRRTDS